MAHRDPTPSPPVSSRRRRRRWVILLIALLVVVIASSLGIWTVTRSWFIIARITPELETRLGGEVAIGSARYDGDGRFIFSDLVLCAPAHYGAAGEIVRIGRAEILVDPTRVWAGDVQLRAVTLDDVLLRFSEDAQDPGQFSFMSLAPRWPEDEDDEPPTPPSVDIRKAVLEYGYHDDGRYTRLGRRLVAGSMRPLPEEDHIYTVQLGEIDAARQTVDDGLAIEGQWNAATLDHHARLNGLALDEDTYNMCPQVLRVWWERMQLEGRLADARIEWDRDQELIVEFTVENVGLTLPFETDDLWARYQDGGIIDERRRPRMRVQSGTIRLENNRLVLDRLVGKLGVDEDARVAAVPYNVSLVIDQLPAPAWDRREQWMDRVLATVPFEMNFFMPAFRVDAAAEEAAVLDLPKRIAQILERFQLTEWTLSTNLRVSRAAPFIGPDGLPVAQPVRTTGSVVIQDAVGRYEKFPYRLDNVDAVLSFDNERMIVEHLVGQASGGTPIRVTGEIRPPGKDAAVDLRLFAENVPVDLRLREALRGSALELFDALQHERSAALLREARLIPDEQALAAPREQRTELVNHLAAQRDSGANESELAPLRDRLARLDQRIEFGAFALGGTVSLDLAIRRPPGRDQRTDVTGTMQLENIGAVYERFPYPFIVQTGTIRWEPDAVVIESDESQPGLSVLTPGGGRGYIRGRIDRPRIDGTRRMRPDLEIEVKADQVNPLMLAAIPLTDSERAVTDGPILWPGLTRSRGARLIEGIGLSGTVDYTGRIAPLEDQSHTGFDFDVSMSGGSATPTRELAELIGAVGLVWPDGFRLEEVNGHLHISRDGLTLSRFEGGHPTGRLRATGTLDLTSKPVTTTMHVDFTDLALGTYLLDLVPGEGAEQARRVWDRYQPEGYFDARLEYRETGGVAASPEVHVDRAHCQVIVGGKPVILAVSGGRLGLSRDAVAFHDLELRFVRQQEDVAFEDGTLRLTGSYGLARAAPALEVAGTWRSGRLDSPIAFEVMDLLGADRVATAYAEFKPAGRFDAQFRYRSSLPGDTEDSAPAFRLDMQPQVVSFSMGAHRLEATLDAGGSVAITPGGAELCGLSGRFEDGPFQLDGYIQFDPLSEVDLRIDYEGSLGSARTQALLPPGVRGVLERLEFRDGGRTALRSCRLRLAHPEDAAPDGRWSVQFDGELEVEGAALTAGARAEGVDGRAMLHVRREAGRPLEVAIEATLDGMRVFGRRVTDVRIPLIRYDDQTRAIEMPELRGDCYDGVVWASAEVTGDDRREYDFNVDLVGLSLGRMYADDDGGDDSAVDDPRRAAASANAPRNRGRLYGGIRVGGVIDQSATRRGRGTVRAIGGNIENIPLVLQLVNLLQFTIPIRGDLDHADIAFYVQGDRIMFERILLESTLGEIAPLQLFGEGEMDIDTFELNTRFRSRSGMLVIRDIAGRLSDELYVIEVTGPLGNPKARIVPLPGLNQPSSDHRATPSGSLTQGDDS